MPGEKVQGFREVGGEGAGIIRLSAKRSTGGEALVGMG
jgi:hypothetical protein